MSKTSPSIDLSVVWDKLSTEEPEPFHTEMVMPTSVEEKPLEAEADQAPRLICQLQIFQA